jgi:hypothetical protein
MIILLVVVVVIVVLILAYNSKKQKDLHSLMVAEVALNNSQVTMVKQHRLNLLLILIRILTRMKEEDKLKAI